MTKNQKKTIKLTLTLGEVDIIMSALGFTQENLVSYGHQKRDLYKTIEQILEKIVTTVVNQYNITSEKELKTLIKRNKII